MISNQNLNLPHSENKNEKFKEKNELGLHALKLFKPKVLFVVFLGFFLGMLALPFQAQAASNSVTI